MLKRIFLLFVLMTFLCPVSYAQAAALKAELFLSSDNESVKTAADRMKGAQIF